MKILYLILIFSISISYAFLGKLVKSVEQIGVSENCKNVVIDSNRCDILFYAVSIEKPVWELAEEYVDNCECWAKNVKTSKNSCNDQTFASPSKHFAKIKEFIEKTKNLDYKKCGELYTIIRNGGTYGNNYEKRYYINNCREYAYSEIDFPTCYPITSEYKEDIEYKQNFFIDLQRLQIETEKAIRDSTDKANLALAKLQVEIEKATQDSIDKANLAFAKKESTDEINSLIERKVETNFISDKCSEHIKAFKEILQVCQHIKDSIFYQQEITEVTALLKANKLEECIYKCNEFNVDELTNDSLRNNFNKKIIDLCKKQLVSKIKKLPLKNINSPELASIYYDNYEQIAGHVIQNDGKMMLISDIGLGFTIMVQYSGKIIGECMMKPNSSRIPFSGYGKYLGEKVYTTISGARQSVPSYQLLWCGY